MPAACGINEKRAIVLSWLLGALAGVRRADVLSTASGMYIHRRVLARRALTVFCRCFGRVNPLGIM